MVISRFFFFLFFYLSSFSFLWQLAPTPKCFIQSSFNRMLVRVLIHSAKLSQTPVVISEAYETRGGWRWPAKSNIDRFVTRVHHPWSSVSGICACLLPELNVFGTLWEWYYFLLAYFHTHRTNLSITILPCTDRHMYVHAMPPLKLHVHSVLEYLLMNIYHKSIWFFRYHKNIVILFLSPFLVLCLDALFPRPSVPRFPAWLYANWLCMAFWTVLVILSSCGRVWSWLFVS